MSFEEFKEFLLSALQTGRARVSRPLSLLEVGMYYVARESLHEGIQYKDIFSYAARVWGLFGPDEDMNAIFFDPNW